MVGAPLFDRTTSFPPATYDDAGRAYVFDPTLPGAPGDYYCVETNVLGIDGGPGTDDELGSSVAITGSTTLGGSTPFAFAGAPGRVVFWPMPGACRSTSET